MILLGLLPIVTFVVHFSLKLTKNRDKSLLVREQFLFSSVLIGLITLLSTEILNHFSKINTLSFVFVWGFFITKYAKAHYNTPTAKDLIISHLKDLSKTEKFCFLSITFIVTLTGLIAFFAPPNNWDSMTYHMSRVVHWQQNASIEHYGTHILRQLNYPPFAEYMIFHIQEMSNTDRWANCVQWFSFIGVIISCSLISFYLGANRKAQWITALLACTVPMAILQASSTQNDLVVSFWILSFVSFLFKYIKQSNMKSLFSGISAISLGFLTKGTAYLFGMPFLLLLIISIIKKEKKKSILLIFISLTLVLVLNSGYFSRNYQLTKTLIPPSESSNVLHNKLNPKIITSNVIRNLGFQLGTPFKAINNSIEKTVIGLNSVLGINLEDDIYGPFPFKFTSHPYHEDHASNAFHTLLILFSLFCFIFYKKLRSNALIKPYLLCIIGSILIFNILVSWQPWHSRYLLPLILLFTPLISIKFSSFKNEKAVPIIVFIIFINALPWLFLNQSRPIISKDNVFTTSRDKQLFANRPSLRQPFDEAVEFYTSNMCYSLGFIADEDSWEYPLWYKMKKELLTNFRIEHLFVENESAPLSDSKFSPCGILVYNSTKPLKLIHNENLYVKVRKREFLEMFQVDMDGDLARRNLKTHLKNVLLSVNKSIKMFQNFSPEQAMRLKSIENLQILRDQYLESQLIDIEEIEKMIPGLGKLTQSQLIRGIELRLKGLIAGNPKVLQAGHVLITQWLSTINQNKNFINYIAQ